MSEKYISGESSPDAPKGVITSENAPEPSNPKKPESLEWAPLSKAIAQATKDGNLSSLPEGYESGGDYWTSINSESPFEVLFLDYRQYRFISPELVQKHFDVLHKFWSEKYLLLNGGTRVKIVARYGAGTVENAGKKLSLAKEKLSSDQGISNYFQEQNSRRFKRGISTIQAFVEGALSTGELTKQAVNLIIASGLKQELEENEIRDYLLTLIKERNFKPRNNEVYEDVFDGHWMTDERWKLAQQRSSVLFGKTVFSLEDIGSVLFLHPEKARTYISNNNYLPIEVTKLHSSDKAMEVENIFRNERDIDKRFLEVVYFLNPSLPFRLEDGNSSRLFKNINEILAETATSYETFKMVSNSYVMGQIHIWLQETNPAVASKLPTDLQMNGFLEFIYSIAPGHPFYLNSERFATPEDIVTRLKSSTSLWSSVSDAIINGHLPKWLEGIGKDQWLSNYNDSMVPFFDSEYHTLPEMKMVAVQMLIQTIDQEVPSPGIIANVDVIELLEIQGSGVTTYDISLRAANSGFIKARVFIDEPVDGVRMDKDTITLHELSGHSSAQITLSVDALQLEKDRKYPFTIRIQSEFNSISIPVKLRVIFPKQAYIKAIVKYAVIGLASLAGLRYLIGAISGYGTADAARYFYPLGSNNSDLPDNYFYFFLAMICIFGLGYFVPRIIKKLEKL